MDKPLSPKTNLDLAHPAAVPILLTSVGIIATCGILYELLISSISSYLLGSSVLHFSLTIGLFLSFMGVGAYLSRFIDDAALLQRFITIEIWLGLVGGASGVILYSAYAFTESYYLLNFVLIATIGSLVGVEIPLLTRLIEHHYTNLKDTLAQVLSFDYLGALVASVLFPLVLLPYLGLTRTSFFIGLLNLAVGIFNLWVFRRVLSGYAAQMLVALGITAVYCVGFFYAFGIQAYLEQFLYQDDVIYYEQSPYQKIVVTRWDEDMRLYLNGNLQFSSADEHRYHEALVHIPMAMPPKPRRVLFLGAGDGLALREVLKHTEVQEIVLVDLDEAMTKLAATHTLFRRLNKDALQNSKVKIIHQDAYKYIESGSDLYDVILIDLPDPSDVQLGKLYSREFYALCRKRLSRDGALVTQASSPFFARRAFWCIGATMAEAFPVVIPYTLHVPSFGQWGFQMALNYQPKETTEVQAARISRVLFDDKKINCRYLTPAVVSTLFVFDADMSRVATRINTLDTQQLVQYYEQSWLEFND